jgi:uncharacterized protein YjeT (DUF2065 family)
VAHRGVLILAALHEQFFPQLQVFLQAQPFAQVHVSVLTQPQDFFAQRHSVWFAIGFLLVFGGPLPVFTPEDAAAARALHPRALALPDEDALRAASDGPAHVVKGRQRKPDAAA